MRELGRGTSELGCLQRSLYGIMTAGAMLLGFVLTALGQSGAQARPAWMDAPPTTTGIAVGKKIPAFRATDQNGKIQDFNSLRGPKGAVIMFNRSADW